MSSALPVPTPPLLVAGIGRAGEAALELLTRRSGPSKIFAWDAQQSDALRVRAKRWRARGVGLSLGGDGVAALRAVGPTGTIVKSPGIDMDVPLLRMAAEQGVQVIDELELGWRTCVAPLVAVTGTNGKSTTCSVIVSILTAAGRRVQRVGNTEFGPPLSAASPDCHIVCEVSSFQLQASPTFLPEIAIFTNLSVEHLTRHRTMEAYGTAKQLMFVRDGSAVGIAVINADDAFGRQIATEVRRAGGRVILYGFSSFADIRILKTHWTMYRSEILIEADGIVTTVCSRLPGRHNALNVAAAFAYGRAFDLGKDVIVSGVASATSSPGRWELIDEGQPFDVVVDYAHTPDGIAQFLSAVRTITVNRGTSLHAVFGAVGLADAEKARNCGEAAAALSDHLVLTTGSAPGSSRVVRLRELRDAAGASTNMELVLDRRQAIAHVISAARPGDVVAILGLGALRRIILDPTGTISPFDDREVAREALRSWNSCVL